MAMRRKGSKDLVLEASAHETAEKIVGDADLARCGIEASIIPAPNPRIVVYDVPREQDNEKVIERIGTRVLPPDRAEDVGQLARVVFRTGRKDAPGGRGGLPWMVALPCD